MDAAWSREEIIALVSLAIALIAAIATVLALKEVRAKFVLIILLAATILVSATIFQANFRPVQEPRSHITAEQSSREEGEQAAKEEGIDRRESGSTSNSAPRRRETQGTGQQAAQEHAVSSPATRELIIGTWASGGARLTFTRDGRVMIRFAPDWRYRFITPDSLELKTWCCTDGAKIVSISADTMIFRAGGPTSTYQRVQ